EVGGGQDVGAAAGRGELVDLELLDGGVGRLARDAAPGEEGEVWSHAADRSRPAGRFEDGRRLRPVERSVEPLPVTPPRAQLRLIHRVLPWFEGADLRTRRTGRKSACSCSAAFCRVPVMSAAKVEETLARSLRGDPMRRLPTLTLLA